MDDQGASDTVASEGKREAALGFLADAAIAYLLVKVLVVVAVTLGLDLGEVPGFDFLAQIFGDAGARWILGLPGISALVGLRSLLARATAWLALLVVLAGALVYLASTKAAPTRATKAPPPEVVLAVLLALLLFGGLAAAFVGLVWVNREAIDQSLQKQAAIHLGFDYELEDEHEAEGEGPFAGLPNVVESSQETRDEDHRRAD